MVVDETLCPQHPGRSPQSLRGEIPLSYPPPEGPGRSGTAQVGELMLYADMPNDALKW